MRALVPAALVPAALVPAALLVLAIPCRLAAQDAAHVAVEATALVLDESRLSRTGFEGITVSGGGVQVVGGRGGDVVIGTRVGGVDVAVWLEAVRQERAVERETTQRILVLSGSAARVASEQIAMDPFGRSATAGPELWVEPTILEDGRIRLKVQTGVGELRRGAFGTIREDVAVQGSTELVVPSGMPVVIAQSESVERTTDGALLRRGGADTSRRSWIVVTARVVTDPSAAFPMPAGIPEDWIR